MTKNCETLYSNVILDDWSGPGFPEKAQKSASPVSLRSGFGADEKESGNGTQRWSGARLRSGLGDCDCHGLLACRGKRVGADDGRVEWGGTVGIGAAGGGGDGRYSRGESGIYRATTGSDGTFVFAKIPPDRFAVVVRRGGKAATAAVQVQLPANPVTITVTNTNTLQMAALAGDANASGTTGGEKLSSESVSSLPLNGRDFSTLLLLAAGTMTDANGATNFTQQFAINGQRGVEAVFAMDGADSSDPEMGGSTFTNFNVDAIQELQSSSGWMPAEIGRGAAGFTNIVTRSGKEGFHGSAFEFLRNSALDARNYFDYPSIAEPGRIPPFKRNEFGFTNGGPVVLPHVYDGRGKTFYFGQYQGFRQVLGTTQVLPMPTAAERAGLDVVKYADGSTDTLTVPVNPAIAAVLKRYPMPNNPTGAYGARTYAVPSNVATNADQFSIRIDQQLGEKGQFLGRFNYDNLTGPTTNPDQTTIDPEFWRAIRRPPAQRGVPLHPHRVAPFLVGVRLQHHPHDAGLPHARTISIRR